jgi:MFS family permease
MFGLVVATYFFLVCGFSIMTTLFALFTARRLGYDAHANGYLFGFIGIVTVIVQGGLIGRMVKIFGETNLARTGLLLTAASLAFLPWCGNLGWLLVACVGLSCGTGFASPPLNGLASQMIDRSWQGRALGVLQSAGSAARLLGPLLGGWLLMFDLRKPVSHYGETPFYAAAFLCFIGVVLAFCLKRPRADDVPETIPVGSSV